MIHRLPLLALLALCLCGCGRSPELQRVDGQLTIEAGKLCVPGTNKLVTRLDPITWATLHWLNDQGSVTGVTITDSQGRFSVESPNQGLGVFEGSYRVVVQEANRPIPSTYRDADLTPFQVDVGAGGIKDLALTVVP